jgi:3-dehydroquinate dehydratase
MHPPEKPEEKEYITRDELREDLLGAIEEIAESRSVSETYEERGDYVTKADFEEFKSSVNQIQREIIDLLATYRDAEEGMTIDQQHRVREQIDNINEI